MRPAFIRLEATVRMAVFRADGESAPATLRHISVVPADPWLEAERVHPRPDLAIAGEFKFAG